MRPFKLVANYTPQGSQPGAIKVLVNGVRQNKKRQTLHGITGSGKTFTMAGVVENVQKPTLVLAHNKTLAAQLYQEFKEFFPENAVEYFVSYYDYYQPEAYIARTDTYIEKDLAINDRIERMRLSATTSLLERKDVLVVSSVSCIYGLGSPESFKEMMLSLHQGDVIQRDDVLLRFVELQYERNDLELVRGSFRVRGEVVDIVPADLEDLAYRIEFDGDIIENIYFIDPITSEEKGFVKNALITPASHYVSPRDTREKALARIQEELTLRLEYFQQKGDDLSYNRLKERTKYDMELIREVGFCKGIENYARHFSGANKGDPPSCLLDYFPKDYLMFVDESHQTLGQVRAMYYGDRSRKNSLVEYGFRLPSALDNRPLQFDEFYEKVPQAIFVSATPGSFEIEASQNSIVKQDIRPTGLLDPKCIIRPATNQVQDLLEELKKEMGRVLITTLTKRLAEELTAFLKEHSIQVEYMHSEIDTLERVQILKDLRDKKFDVLVGINLLREGLDLPEVSLVAILDADREGFLRSETSLIQTIGRAARNKNGRVILYADRETESIKNAVAITHKRRQKQALYNKEHGISPKTTARSEAKTLVNTFFGQEMEAKAAEFSHLSKKELEKHCKIAKKKMLKAAKEYSFEEAARYRDQLRLLEKTLLCTSE